MSSILTIGCVMTALWKKLDSTVLIFFRRKEIVFARLAIFTVYFWFGALKATGMSPATPLVMELYDKTLSGVIAFPVFYGAFAVFEMAIGALFLLRGMERPAIVLVSAHLLMTALPLALLPDIAWQGFLAPTLEGQYIIKNILIVALAVVVGAHIRSRSGDPTAETL